MANGAKIESIISTMPRSPEGIDYGVDEDGVGRIAGVDVTDGADG